MLFNKLTEGLMLTAHAQTSGGSGDLLYDELWSEPRNLVGSPRNRVMAASAVGNASGGTLPAGAFSCPRCAPEWPDPCEDNLSGRTTSNFIYIQGTLAGCYSG